MSTDFVHRTRIVVLRRFVSFGARILFAGLVALPFAGIARGEDLKDALAQAAAARGPEQGARVTILVNDEDCNPLPDSAIEISTAWAGPRARATAGKEGIVKFNIAPGVFNIGVFHDGFVPLETVLVVPMSGAEAELTLRCARGE